MQAEIIVATQCALQTKCCVCVHIHDMYAMVKYVCCVMEAPVAGCTHSNGSLAMTAACSARGKADSGHRADSVYYGRDRGIVVAVVSWLFLFVSH